MTTLRPHSTFLLSLVPCIRFVLIACLVAVVGKPQLASADDSAPIAVATLEHAGAVDFEGEILPILRRNCLACHSKGNAEAGLVLETPVAIRRGGDSGEAVAPGHADESLLLSVSSHQAEPVMPPEGNEVEAKNLTPAELGLLKLWIDQGAEGEVGRGSEVEFSPPPATLKPVYAVAVMSHGDYVAAGRANQVNVYHVPSQQRVAQLVDPELANSAPDQAAAAHHDMVHSLAASPDGLTIASGGYRTVKLWRREPPRQQPDTAIAATVGDALEASQANPTSEASHDGRYRVVIDADGVGQIQNAADGESLVQLQTNQWQQRAADDARREVAIAKKVLTWAEYDRNEVSQMVKRAEQKVKSLGDELQSLIEKGETSTDAKYQQAVDALAFRATDLKQLAATVVGAEKVVDRRREEVAAAETSLKNAKTLAASPAAVLRVAAFNANGEQLAAADSQGRLHLFAVPSGAPIDVIAAAENDTITAVAYAADGQLVAKMSGGNLQSWQPARWSHVRTIGNVDAPEVLTGRVTALGFSPDGKLLATGGGETSRSGELKIWNVATGELVRTIENAHSDTVLGIEFSNDGVYLASCGSDRNMCVFSAAKGDRVQSFEYHTSYVLDVSWRADGRVLATVGGDNVVRVWNFKTGNEHKVIKRFDDREVTAIQFLGNSGEFVVSAANSTVSRWNYNGGGGQKYDGVASFMYAIGADRSGQTIAAGGHDGTVHVWRRDGTQLATFK